MAGTRFTLYRIVVKGVVSTQFAAAFGDVRIEATGTDTLLLTRVEDQAALHGILRTLQDYGVELIAVEAVEEHASEVRPS